MIEFEILEISLLHLLYAIFCGGLIGFERESKNKNAGLKTNLLICAGATLLTTFSMAASSAHGEQVRIIAQIVSGVGFLGAGAIIRSGNDRVSGLTTAAMIWLVAAIGIGIGMGYGPTCVVLTLILMGIVQLIYRLERRLFPQNSRLHPSSNVASENQSE